ncbi:cupin domain-containing protein [Pricia sp.]|uniref:cupin domain-containing protein n=1 Tax=Pricia sp. TaxID=2268138 RepID=UPI0035936762
MDWKPLEENGAETKGIFVKVLRYDKETKRAPTFLLKFEAGASYPYHDHPAGEEAFVMEGEAYFDEHKLAKGDYLYTPPTFKHSVKLAQDARYYLSFQKRLKLLPTKTQKRYMPLRPLTDRAAGSISAKRMVSFSWMYGPLGADTA